MHELSQICINYAFFKKYPFCPFSCQVVLAKEHATGKDYASKNIPSSYTISNMCCCFCSALVSVYEVCVSMLL